MAQEASSLLATALILTSGLTAGEIAARFSLPRVTGWILSGAALRLLPLPALEYQRLAALRPQYEFVLGYIAFAVGSHLNLRRLRNAGKRLGILVVTEATVTPMCIVLALRYLGGLGWSETLLLAAIGVAGSPGATLSVIRDCRARGIFVKTLMAACALIDMVAVCLYETCHVLVPGVPPDAEAGFLSPILVLAGGTLLASASIGATVALAVLLLARSVVGRERIGICMIAAISLAFGVASAFGTSPVLACTFAGMALSNLMSEREQVGESYLLTVEGLLFTFFYTLAGMRLDFAAVLPVAPLVALYFLGRGLGKLASGWMAMSLAGSIQSVRSNLGMALLPHGGVAVGLILFTQDHPQLAPAAPVVVAIGLSTLAVNQVIGPSLTRLAVQRAGEAGKDRARLIDFLQEENIVTGFQADTKAQAIEALTQLLVRTHALEIDRGPLLQAILEREAVVSTCVGGGLMIPHTTVPGIDRMQGVMALSRSGLAFETPDGVPVHCIVLLVTPPGQEERHLAVLAALARAIGTDPRIQAQLFEARSPAHAWEVLHAEEAEDFNYFLEDATRA